MSATLFAQGGKRYATARAATALLARDKPGMTDKGLLARLPQGSPATAFQAAGEIYAEGEAADSFYKVERGVVRTCKFASDGRRQIEAFYVTGEVFGFEAGDVYELCAEAVTDCTVISYRRGGLDKMLASDGTMALRLFSYAMHCVQRSRSHALLLGRGNATQKIAAFLLELLGGRLGNEAIELVMPRQDIADYLGMTIETVSRTLSQLERAGIIDFVTLWQVSLKNPAALREMIG